MKLLIFIHSLSSGGAERVTTNLANYWAEKGWKITIVTMSGRDLDFYELHPTIHRIAVCLDVDSTNLLAAIKYNYRRIKALRKVLKQEQPDVALAMMTTANILLALAAKGLNIPALGSEHSYPPMLPLGRVWEWLRRRSYCYLAAVTALTEESAAWLKTQTTAQYVPIIPNAVTYPIAIHTPKISPEMSRDNSFNLIAVGRLSSEKGFERLLLAFAVLVPRFPDWNLTILGEGGCRDSLEKKRLQLGLEHKVSLPGVVGNLEEWYEAADLYVMTSLYEGFGNTLAEAMAYGLPTVSVDCDTGPRDIIRHEVDGLLIPQNNHEALVEALATLMSDKALRQQYAARAVQIRERLSMEKIAGMWERVFVKINGNESFRQMKKILFFIRSLNAGGAERQLVVTAKALAQRGHKVTVLTFYSGGFYADEFTDTNVQLLSLHKKGRWDLLAFIFRLFVVLRKQAPDVIYSFLGTANILTVLLRPFIPPTRVVWGVRASNMDLDKYDWLSRWSYWVECRMARFADTIIANSHAGLEYAVAHGFPEKNIMVIPNGIDTERFRSDKSAGERLRKVWGIAEDELLIGVVGRIDPMKGHPTFLEAAALIKQQHSKVRFVCVGTGEVVYEKSMHKLATELGVDDVLIWAGRHSDMVAVYNALDIASSSSSYGEGFPNVLGEAMSCGVPCVVTDIGDSALVVGGTGLVVPVKDSKALSTAWGEMFALDSAEFKGLSAIVRERVISEFSVRALLESTEKVLIWE